MSRELNLKSSVGCLSVFLLAMTGVGLVRFGVDLWHYFHAAEIPNRDLDYRGLWMALSGVVASAILFSVFRKMRN